MLKKTLLLSVFLLVSVAHGGSITPAEKEYIRLHSKALTELSKLAKQASQIKDEKKADQAWENYQAKEGEWIGKLNQKLLNAVGIVEVPSGYDQVGYFNTQETYDGGRLSLLSCFYYPLKKSEANFEAFVVTTENIAKEFEPKLAALDTNSNLVGKDRELFNGIFDSDAGIYNYAEVPVKKNPSMTFARAFLAIQAQDYGAFNPDYLFVVFKKNNQLFFMQKQIMESEKKDTEIAKCKTEYEKSRLDPEFQKKYPKGEAAIKGRDVLQESYYTCYSQEAKKQKFFPKLIVQAQELVDRFK